LILVLVFTSSVLVDKAEEDGEANESPPFNCVDGFDLLLVNVRSNSVVLSLSSLSCDHVLVVLFVNDGPGTFFLEAKGDRDWYNK
jgi:hypothetical protein